MCRRQRERGKKMLQRAEGAGRLLLTMQHDRFHGKDKTALVLLRETKLFTYKHGFNSFSIKRVEGFFFLDAINIGVHFSSRMSEFFLYWYLVIFTI